MMIVPDYWAEGRVQHRERGKQVTIRRYGWSETSMAEAQAMADARADEALARLLAGERVARLEHKATYNGAEGMPIREEVLAREDGAVITRNVYGARCLNVPDVLFADVDFDRDAPVPFAGARFLAVLAAGVAGGWLSGWKDAVLFAVVAWGFGWAAARGFALLRRRTQGMPEQRARAKVDRFVAAHPQWRLALYRTPAGLRLLALHRCFDPDEAAVGEFFDAIGVDVVYRRMCERQHCFRARLTAKPWRIGIANHLRPRPGVWPIKSGHLPRRAQWVAEYERRAEGYAACRLLDTLGQGSVDPRAERVRGLHDAMTRATTELPLA